MTDEEEDEKGRKGTKEGKGREKGITITTTTTTTTTTGHKVTAGRRSTKHSLTTVFTRQLLQKL
ncbi:hypothetical protein E2C01_031070 [Portunus trituberculatus]|uniref:Uncharacterized protein n=1 Tax=Portunus trituberculatus TaxID=210409 RepID=A0A5B7EXK8_PORTR|nr:hypothetical protein [Portunus trituberculatus]